MEQYCNEAIPLLRELAGLDPEADDAARGRATVVSAKLDDLYWRAVRRTAVSATGGRDEELALPYQAKCLLDFGVAPAVITSMGGDMSSPETRRALGFMEMGYGELHAASGVYNFEPWLREMLRDFLDLDRIDLLKIRLASIQEAMKAVPQRLIALGVPQQKVTELVTALRGFTAVQGSMKRPDKRGSSVIASDIRGYVDAQDRIEAAAPATAGGENAIRNIVDMWRDATLELVEIRGELRGAGTSKKETAAHTAALLDAVRDDMRACGRFEPLGQRSALMPEEATGIIPRQTVEKIFAAVQMYDIVGDDSVENARLETRRFGPLCALIAPGRGFPRYASALRELHAKRIADGKKEKRAFDIDRRLAHPMSYLLVPNRLDPAEALQRLTEAYLEYKQIAAPARIAQMLEETRKRFSFVYDSASNDENAFGGRREISQLCRLARYVSGFVFHAAWGRDPGLPKFEEFLPWATGRLGREKLLVSPRYKCIVDDFRAGSPERRGEIFRRHKRERYDLDLSRCALFACAGRTDDALGAILHLPGRHREDTYLEQARQFALDSSPRSKSRCAEAFRKFFLAEEERRRAFLAMESLVEAEVGLLRNRAKKQLGRDMRADEARPAVVERRLRALDERTAAVNRRIDRLLLGFLYFADGVPVCAREEMEGYLARLEGQRTRRRARKETYDGSTIIARLGEPASAAEKTVLMDSEAVAASAPPGEESVFEDDFVYFNLGVAARETGALEDANDYLSRFTLWAAEHDWRLFGKMAAELNDDVAADMESARKNEILDDI